MSIEELRKKIDEVDTGIVRLIAERIRLASRTGRIKRKQGRQIEDRQREEKILEHIRDLARVEGVSRADMEGIYRQIFVATKNIQSG